MKQKLSEDGQEATTQRRMMMENGHPGVEVDESAIRRGENPYTKYYQQQGEQQLPSDTQVCPPTCFNNCMIDINTFVSLNHYVSRDQ